MYTKLVDFQTSFHYNNLLRSFIISEIIGDLDTSRKSSNKEKQFAVLVKVTFLKKQIAKE